MKKNIDKPTDIGTFMVAAGAILEDPETEQILLLQRSEDNYKPGIWETGYGRIDQGEDPEMGLRREIREETGIINVTFVRLLTGWHFYRGDDTAENEVIGLTYWCQTRDTEVRLSREHQEYQWVTLDKALELVTEPGVLRDINAFIEAKTEAAKLNLAQQKEQRALADYHNLQRRTAQERTKLAKFATQQVIEDLLQPLSHLDMATHQINDTGLTMVVQQLKTALENHGLQKIDVLGKKFDVETMEVVDKNGTGDTVIKVVQDGYRLYDMVIQHAKVVLGEEE
ncbi:MAG: nucleotide exchange factor GrpE [Microgenomates group bacterium]